MSKWINETRAVELRAIPDDENRFEGLACKYDVVDSYGTRFVPGCFTRGGLDTSTYSLLWMHDPTRPVGTFTAEEREDGLYIVGRWDDNTAGQEARVAALSGSASDLSVGFTWMKEDGAEENDITIARLQEVSQVTSRFGAVPGSVLTAVRSAIEEVENGTTDECCNEDNCCKKQRHTTEYHHAGDGEVIQGSPEAEEAEVEAPADETEEERYALGGDVFTTQEEAEAKAEELGCEGTHSMQMDGQTVYMPCSTHSEYESSRAEPGELMEGDFVSYVSGEGTGYGRVEYIMTEGVFGVEGDPLSMPASEDEPFALIRVYNEEEGALEPTDVFVGKMFSELTKLAPVMDTPEDVEASDDQDNRAFNMEILARYIDTL